MKYNLNQYDAVLNELKLELNKCNFSLSSNSKDGRINSIINEDEIIEKIMIIYKNIKIFKELKLTIEKQPKHRWWYDILIKNDDNSFYCPINIKISDFSNSSADNISSKEGLYFSLTGEILTKVPNTWGSFFKKLSSNIKNNSTDYFFLIINKNNNETFYNSLRRLNKLTPNGNNLPFQCKWSENTNIIDRTFNDSKKYILNILEISVKKRAKILEEFNEFFKEY